MKNKLMTLIGMIMLTAIAANAQKITEGDKKLSFLSGETSFKIQYIYDDMQVGEMSEADYREKKVSEMNAKQRGKGDKWEKNWVGAREFKYEPKFEELMNKYLKDVNGYASKDEKERWTRIRRVPVKRKHRSKENEIDGSVPTSSFQKNCRVWRRVTPLSGHYRSNGLENKRSKPFGTTINTSIFLLSLKNF